MRVFGGFDFTAKDLERSDFAEHGYASGVPMGGDLKAAPAGKAPAFVIRAMRDPDGANLDRIQVVKGWMDAEGKTHEKIYDVAWSGDAQAGQGRQAAAGRQHRECRRKRPTRTRSARRYLHGVLAGSAVQPEASARSTTSACWRSRRRAGRRYDAKFFGVDAAEGRAREHPGARVHVADLVQPRLKATRGFAKALDVDFVRLYVEQAKLHAAPMWLAGGGHP